MYNVGKQDSTKRLAATFTFADLFEWLTDRECESEIVLVIEAADPLTVPCPYIQ